MTLALVPNDAKTIEQMIRCDEERIVHQWFVESVLDYGRGCDDGKREFLADLELPLPTVSARFSFEVRDADLLRIEDMRNYGLTADGLMSRLECLVDDVVATRSWRVEVLD